MYLKSTTTKQNSFHTGLPLKRSLLIAFDQKYKLTIILNCIELFSIFYVYYEQYLTIWKDASFSLGISLATIFTVSFILTGFDFIAALIILLLVTLIVINMGGMMWLFNISLNAISLVNLVVVSIV